MSSAYLTPDRTPAQRGEVPTLDGLRALSIGIVLLGHFLLPPRYLGFSAFGVVIFFFISGFLISRLLFAEMKTAERVSLKNFYVRRFLRLYPVIVFYMLLVCLLALARGIRPPPIEIASVFAYFANYLIAWRDVHGVVTADGGLNILPIGVLWSLSVEEHFYFLFPAVFVFARGSPSKVARFAIFICVASLAFRFAYVLFLHDYIGSPGIYKRSETRFDSIAFGILLAAMCETDRGRKLIAALARRWIFWAALAGVAATFALRNPLIDDTLRYTVRSALLLPIFCTILFSDRAAWANWVLNLAPVAWIGRLSYSIYVWHGGVRFLTGSLLDRMPHLERGVVSVVATLILAVLSYYLIERPFLRLRRYFQERGRVAPGDPDGGPGPTLRVVIATPGGADGGGGMGTVSRSIREEMVRAHPEVDCHVVDARGHGSALLSPFFTLGAALRLLRWRLEPVPIVLHLQVSERMSLLRKGMLARLAKLLHIPVVVHHHGAEFLDVMDRSGPLSRWWSGALVRGADCNIVLGRPWRDYLVERMGVPAERVVLLYNAVSDRFGGEEAAARAAAGGNGAAGIRVLMLANLSERKGVSQLLEAIAAIHEDGRAITAALVGGGEVERFRGEAARLGIGDICVLPGWVAASEIPTRLRAADVLVLPSFNEGLPMAIIEAMSAGVPVIATPVGSIPEVLTSGENCLLVEPGDAGAVRAAILEICDDAETYRRLSASARAVYEERFLINRYASQLLAIYRSLGAHPAPRLSQSFAS